MEDQEKTSNQGNSRILSSHCIHVGTLPFTFSISCFHECNIVMLDANPVACY